MKKSTVFSMPYNILYYFVFWSYLKYAKPIFETHFLEKYNVSKDERFGIGQTYKIKLIL